MQKTTIPPKTLPFLEATSNHYFIIRASPVVQTVKNLPAMQETQAQSLGQEDALEKETATHFSILAWRIPTDRGTWWATVHGVTKSQTRLSNQAHTLLF